MNFDSNAEYRQKEIFGEFVQLDGAGGTGRLVRVQVMRVPRHLPVGLALGALEQDLLKVHFLQEGADFGTTATLSEILTTEQLLGQSFFQ